MPKSLFLAVAALVALPAAAAFKCVDAKGRAHYEESPPAACAEVTIYEVNASGTVVRKIEPQKSGAAVAPPPKPESERAALDRQRRDRTLLDTFSSEQEIDRSRDRSLELIRARKTSAESQLELVRKRHKQMEATKANAADLEAVGREESTLQHSIAGYDAEIERTQKQFETDKVRWRELKAARGG